MAKLDNYECDGQISLWDISTSEKIKQEPTKKTQAPDYKKPCPYTNDCSVFGYGCAGLCHWCGQKGYGNG